MFSKLNPWAYIPSSAITASSFGRNLARSNAAQSTVDASTPRTDTNASSGKSWYRRTTRPFLRRADLPIHNSGRAFPGAVNP